MLLDIEALMTKQAVRTIARNEKLKALYLTFYQVEAQGEKIILVRLEDREKNTTKEIPLVAGVPYGLGPLAIAAIELITEDKK